MKKLVPAITLSAILASPAYAEKPKIEALVNDNHRHVYKTELVVNTDDSLRVIVNKCEEEGVKDIRKMASKYDVEEGWVYIPERCVWIDIGKNQVPGGTTPDFAFTRALGKQFKKIVVYHFHPKNSRTSQLRLLQALPSPTDIYTMIGQSILMHQANYGTKYTAKVVSQHGVATYQVPTPKGNLIMLDTLRQWAGGYGGVRMLAQRFIQPYIDTVMKQCFGQPLNYSQKQEVKKRINKCAQINTQYYTITFKPFKD